MGQKEIKEKIKLFLELNENENTNYQGIWNTVKAVLKGKFIAIRHTPTTKKKLK